MNPTQVVGRAESPAVPTAADADRARRRRRRKRQAKDLALLWATRIVLLGVLFAVWENQSGVHLNPFFFASPSQIWSYLWTWSSDGELWRNLLVTCQEAGTGFILGAIAGIVLGILFGELRFVRRVFDPAILALYSLPKIALIPLLIIWFGLGKQPKIVLAAVTVFFLVFYTTLAGVLRVDRELVAVARVLGASRLEIILKIVLPSALAGIFTGLHISVPYAIVGAVTGEIIASNAGMGYLIQRSANSFETAGVFAGLVVLMLVTVGLTLVLRWLERRLLGWQDGGGVNDVP